MTKVFEKQITAVQVLSAEHFYELCRSFNFSVALGADASRVGGWRPLSEGSPKAWRSTVTLYLFCQHFIVPSFSGTRRVLPFFDLELRAEPSSSFDKSAPLGATTNCFSGLPPSNATPKVVPLPAYRYPFLASFLPLAAENITSRFVFFLLAKRKRSAEKDIVPKPTNRPSILRQA